MEVLERVQKGSGKPYITVDSLYGCLELLERAPKSGIGSVMKCRKDRPSWLFSTMSRIVTHVYGKKPRIGVFCSASGISPGGFPFTAYSIVLKRKHDGNPTFGHFLSTLHSVTDIGVGRMVVSERQEKDGVRVTEETYQGSSGVLAAYNHNAGFIDQVNRSLYEILPRVRFSRWICQFVVMVFMLICCNAQRLLSVFTNQLPSLRGRSAKILAYLKELGRNQSQFFVELMHAMSPRPLLEPGSSHEIHRLRDCQVTTRTGRPIRRLSCAFCSLNYKTANRTSDYCKVCQSAICKRCIPHHINHHESFIQVKMGMRKFVPIPVYHFQSKTSLEASTGGPTGKEHLMTGRF